MKERPTPETDAHMLGGSYSFDGDFARKLERERDEARAELTNVYRWIERNHPDGFIDSQSHHQNLERVTEHIHDKMDKLERERDDTPWHSNGETKDEWFARQREKYIVVKRERNEALVALREAWFAMDELVDVPDRIINWQNKYAYTLEETK